MSSWREALRLMDGCRHECRHAWRSLRRSRGFAAGTVAVLALTIGANSAIFSAVHGVLLRPLPYRDAHRIVSIRCERQYADARGPVPATFRLADLRVWRERLPSFDAMAFFATDGYVLRSSSGSRVLPAAVVSDAFFPILGASFAAGGPFSRSRDVAPEVLISARLARESFATPQEAVGASLELNSRSHRVAGVLDDAFALPSPDVDAWLPAEPAEAFTPRTSGFQPIGRLRVDATIGAARAEIGALAGPEPFGNTFRATAVPLRDMLAGDLRPTLMLLWAAAGLTLVAGCTNVANLLLARSHAAARETAIRAALGASRGRLLLRAFAEAGILAAAGTALGLGVAGAAVRAFAALDPSPALAHVAVNGPVLLFTAGVGTLTALAVGVLPAMGRSALAPWTPASRTAPPSARATGRVLCIAEFAVAMVLLVGATLLGRSLFELLRTDAGIDPKHVTAAALRLGPGPRRDSEAAALTDRMVERTRVLPGVVAAGAGSALPPQTGGITLTLKRKGDVVDYAATAVTVTPGYFEALGIRLLEGRAFDAGDSDARPPVVILSDATARRFFGDADPIGRTLTLPTLRDGVKGSAEMTVVGIVAPVKYSGLADEADEQVYRPFAQQPWSSVFLVARTTADPAGFVSLLRREIAAVDAAVPVVSIRTLDSIVAEETRSPRMRSVVLGTIAVLDLALAAAGLYSVIAYSVSRRSPEIAVRMALGAHHRDVARMVLREGMVLGVLGTAVGLVAAAALAGSLRVLLFPVGAAGPGAFVLSAAFLLLLALAASYVPARRASRVDPVVALRAE